MQRGAAGTPRGADETPRGAADTPCGATNRMHCAANTATFPIPKSIFQKSCLALFRYTTIFLNY